MQPLPGATEGEEKWGVKAHGKRAEREPITGVWGQSPQRGPGGRAPGRGQGAKPPLKLKAFCFRMLHNQGRRFRFLFLLSFKVIRLTVVIICMKC